MLIEQFKDTTGVIIAVNLRTDNTMAKRKNKKEKKQTTLYKPLHRKLKDSSNDVCINKENSI